MKFDSLGENANAAAFVFQWQNNGSKYLQVLPAGDVRLGADHRDQAGLGQLS